MTCSEDGSLTVTHENRSVFARFTLNENLHYVNEVHKAGYILKDQNYDNGQPKFRIPLDETSTLI